MIQTILEDKNASIIISFLLGLGIASMFKRVCNDEKCRVIKGPNPEEIQNTTYKTDDGCYRYEPYPVKCSFESLRRSTIKGN